MGEACTALGTPVTGGNVSLYNESPTRRGLSRRPSIGMVGLHRRSSSTSRRSHVHDAGRRDRAARRADTDELGAQRVSRARSTASSPARPPRVRPRRASARSSTRCSRRSRDGTVRSAHDCSDGGLAVALAECCMMDRDAADRARRSISRRGARCPAARCCSARRRDASSSRRPIPAAVLAIAAQHGVPARADRRGDVAVDGRSRSRSAARRSHVAVSRAGRRVPRGHSAHHVTHRVARSDVGDSPSDSQV